MKKPIFSLSIVIVIVVSGCVKNTPENFVLVKGGSLINKTSDPYVAGKTIPDFYMGKYELTQKEWVEIMGSNPSQFKGDDLPVEMVSWYDCIEYCNKRSIREGLSPCYIIEKNVKDFKNKNVIDSIKWTITFNDGANGYRLPTEAEWEYAAGGGQKGKGCTYSGSNDIDKVAWYWRNSGEIILAGAWNWPRIEKNRCKTKPIGLKDPNGLGLYDMSGNVREWCDNWYEDKEINIGFFRVQRGGGWLGGARACAISYRGKFEASAKGPDQGIRLCRSVNTY